MVDNQKQNNMPIAGKADPASDLPTDGIATKLRELYDEIENQGIPDNLVHLLDKLDQAEKAQSANQQQED